LPRKKVTGNKVTTITIQNKGLIQLNTRHETFELKIVILQEMSTNKYGVGITRIVLSIQSSLPVFHSFNKIAGSNYRTIIFYCAMIYSFQVHISV